MTCQPDYLVMGMSAVTFFDGEKGADRFTREVEETSGIKISIGSDACTAAMRAYGGVKRIAILSPYWPSMNTEVARYFGDKGFTVVRDKCLQCRSWIQIAEQTTETLRAAADGARRRRRRRDRPGRHQLSMVRLAAAAEMWLGKPIIAINTATYWHALRPTASRTAWKASAGCWRSSETSRYAMTGARYGSATVSRIIDLDPFALPLAFLFPAQRSKRSVPPGTRWPARMSIGPRQHTARRSKPPDPLWRQDHPDRCLCGRAQAAAGPAGLAPAQRDKLSRQSSGIRMHAGRHRHRNVHPPACRSRRLEHAARLRALGADVRQCAVSS